jgi:hypothetical protein
MQRSIAKASSVAEGQGWLAATAVAADTILPRTKKIAGFSCGKEGH